MNELNSSQRIAISLIVRVSAQAIEQHSVASPYVVGEEFALQVTQHAHQLHLGYFPPADYFRGGQLIDSELLETLDSICWLVKGMVEEEVRSKLCALFATVETALVQALAHTMPVVRPAARNAARDLALHFTPDHIRINVITTFKSSLSKQAEKESVATLKKQVEQCLANCFTSLEITDLYYLDASTH